MSALPSQDELRRRLRAGRVLANLNVAELAARVDPEAGLGERTLRKLESGETQIRSPALREIAAALGLPYAWFTVESIPDAFSPSAEWIDRLAGLEAAHAELEQALQTARSNGDFGPTPSAPRTVAARRGPRGTRQAQSPQ